MLDRRKAEASRVLEKAGRIDFHAKWLLFDKRTDTAHDHVADSEAAAKQAIADLDLDSNDWEVVGPVEMGAGSAVWWRWPDGSSHISAIRFENVGTAKDPRMVTFVDLGNGETRRYEDGQIEWALFCGDVGA